MNVLSLFDGMSCGRIALERTKFKIDNYYASEIDPYAIKVSEINFPDIIRLGDILTLDVNSLVKIDLVMGGSPCQGFSFAGRQLNFQDPRSRLFFEFVDILKKVLEINPRAKFLFENVYMKKEWQDVISKHLGCEPIEINSSLFSGQLRRRLYWTNICVIGTPNDAGVSLKDIIQNGYVDRDKSFCIDASYWKGGNPSQYVKKSRRQLVFSDDEILPKGFKRIEPMLIGGRMATGFRKLNPTECEMLQTVPVGFTDHVSNLRRYTMLGNGWTIDVISWILSFYYY